MDGVMEPEGDPLQASGAEPVENLKTRSQMRLAVIPAMRLPPTQQQRLPQRGGQVAHHARTPQ